LSNEGVFALLQRRKALWQKCKNITIWFKKTSVSFQENKLGPKISVVGGMDHCLWKSFIWQVGIL